MIEILICLFVVFVVLPLAVTLLRLLFLFLGLAVRGLEPPRQPSGLPPHTKSAPWRPQR